ncbi:MAG: LysM peptidoglycan-binding domain-containing protein, partial [Flavobacterium sp.]|nr:LysM peptidoglycan-binding domain-containing protein [Flavobacterium sp.]
VKIKDAKQRSIHIVRSGENLGLIANKYRTSVSRIQALNGLKGTNIYPGQKLIVFNSEGIQKSSSNTAQKSTASTSTIDGITITHTVKSGDTLWDIAKAYNSTIESIRELNQLGTSSKLQLGQKLKVRTRT